MNLDLINNLFNTLKENKFVQNFISELSNSLENSFKCRNEKVPIIEDIVSHNKLTTSSENSIRIKLNDIILNYAQKKFNNDSMFFVKDSRKSYWSNNKKHFNNDVYTVLEITNRKIEELEIDKKDMPLNINVNDVLKLENGKYLLDDISTKELQKEILDMANEIINNQNFNLEKHRKEGHLYMVTEELGHSRFLWDLTNAPKNEFEEIDFPQDLLNMVTEGTVLKYTNGKYEYYSDDGFERAKKLHS